MYVIHHPSPTICLRRGVLGEEEDKLMAFPQPFLLLAWAIHVTVMKPAMQVEHTARTNNTQEYE